MSVVTDLGPSRLSTPVARYDAAVVGAGPYGLSTAAHLLGRGLRVAVFGKTLEFWRKHMPEGMLLRSHWWATNLSDPGKKYGFEQFFNESRYSKGYPIPRQAFIEYGRWFQQRAVPSVDETYVRSIERDQGGFLLTLEDGRKLRTDTVVMAIGLYYFAHRPAPFSGLPAELASHSSDHRDLGRFQGRTVMVIGGGQSALEYTALLREAGADVHLVSRRPVLWLEADRANERTIFEQILAPNSGIAPGWTNWCLEHVPYLFHRLSRQTKERALRVYYAATAAQWLRDRVIGKATLHEGQHVTTLAPAGRQVDATLANGTKLAVDHIILATGYQIDVDRLPMIHPALRSEIKRHMGVPVLNRWFESSVPGLYFVGLSSLPEFGPLFRFVVGCKAAAPRVARSIARKKVRTG